MQKIIVAGLLTAAAAFTAAPAWAEFSIGELPGKFTGNVALVSDYMFGGISETNNNAAVQGGFDWDSGMGIGTSVFVSTINFRDNNLSTTEFNLSAHYGGTFGHFSYEGGVHYFWYPGVPAVNNYDFWAPYGKVGYDFGFAKIETNIFMPDTFHQLGNAAYFLNTLTVPIIKQFKIEANFGHFLRPKGGKNLTDWNVGGILKVFNWFDLDVRYYDSDIKFLGNLADSRIVVKVSRSF